MNSLQKKSLLNEEVLTATAPSLLSNSDYLDVEVDGIISALADVDLSRSSGCILVGAMDMWLILELNRMGLSQGSNYLV
jgi:hypothetical protein